MDRNFVLLCFRCLEDSHTVTVRHTQTTLSILRRLSLPPGPPTTTAKGRAVPCGLGYLSRRCAAPVSVSQISSTSASQGVTRPRMPSRKPRMTSPSWGAPRRGPRASRRAHSPACGRTRSRTCAAASGEGELHASNASSAGGVRRAVRWEVCVAHFALSSRDSSVAPSARRSRLTQRLWGPSGR